ncbi:hypothetical protein [Erwinia persicina]|uniref:hypothetical protein n=1 Tax=Erwinia persicina TaxID=55211 RepID=UPI0017815488|nr:hypothetical protein [Erwinia persicina]MBD8164404.1 hypothetical protein [Erwinia persicina]MBD8216170.1 hypothetical protein [Erwinia persicina]
MQPFRDKTPFTALIPLMLIAVSSLFTPFSTAEKIVISLSQEQDGGDAGRACIYVHKGKAEFRLIRPDEACAPEITVNQQRS